MTARDGKYTLGNLTPGAYDVSITGVPAMSNFERKNVAIDSKPAVLEIRMDFNTQLGTLGEDRVNLAADARRHNPPSGPTPRTKDGKPDLSGVWWRPRDVDGGSPQFLPAAEALSRERRELNNKDNPQTRCLPGAVLRFGPLFEMVQSEKYLVIINDDESPGFHQVYLNGRHPDDPNPAWYGHNTARWDGDTLVVDRVAFDERIWLDQGAHPHSPKLHVVERYRRPDLGPSGIGGHRGRSGRAGETVHHQASSGSGARLRYLRVHMCRERARRSAHGRQIAVRAQTARRTKEKAPGLRPGPMDTWRNPVRK